MPRFVIPKPWDPGYALPDNMRAEGLRSGAYVTEWAPRGTYDDPNPHDPSWDKSYAMPEYILAEGYGQGAYVTEWPARGTYVGQTVKRAAKQIRAAQTALGDVDPATPNLFAEYGRRASAIVMARVMKLPPSVRKDAIKKVLGAIDPNLYNSAAQHANALAAKGAPASTALALGLAKSMSNGIGKEIVDIGKRRVRKPAPRGQVGLGCYGLAGLGAIPKSVVPATAVVNQLQAAPLAAGQCRLDANGNPAFIWVAETPTVAGHWERLRAGQTCSGIYAAGGAVDVRDQRGGAGGGGGITGGTGQVAVPPELQLQMLQVGPFTIPLNVASFGIKWSQPLPAEWQAPIIETLSHDTDLVGTGMVDAKPGKIWNRLRAFLPGMPTRVNQRFIGLRDGGGGSQGTLVQSAEYPVIRTTRPDNGEDWGMFMTVQPRDLTKPWDSTSNPYLLALEWKKIDKGFFASIWDWIKNVASKIVDFVGDALDAIGDLACGILTNPAAGVAAGATAAAYGVPPQTGAQGVAVAAAACGTTPPPAPPATSSFDDLWPIALAGVGVIALATLIPKKKKKAHP